MDPEASPLAFLLAPGEQRTPHDLLLGDAGQCNEKMRTIEGVTNEVTLEHGILDVDGRARFAVNARAGYRCLYQLADIRSSCGERRTEGRDRGARVVSAHGMAAARGDAGADSCRAQSATGKKAPRA